MDIHEHSHRLPNDECHPHSCIAIVPLEEAAYNPGQWDLRTHELKSGGCNGHRYGVQHRFRLRETSFTEFLTWAIMAVNAQRRNIRRGTLTRY